MSAVTEAIKGYCGRFILCSDGAGNTSQLMQSLSNISIDQYNCEDLVDFIIGSSLISGGFDNCTSIAVEYKG